MVMEHQNSIPVSLKFYLGGYALSEDGGYVAKVFAEEALLDQVAAGQKPSLPDRVEPPAASGGQTN